MSSAFGGQVPGNGLPELEEALVPASGSSEARTSGPVTAAGTTRPEADPAAIRAFVHLAYGFGAENWHSRWSKGEILGINESRPYGYYHAEQFGVRLQHSEDHPEGRLEKALRYVIRGLTGFDLVHAWRNRKGVLGSEVIWTHTESQALAVLAVLRLCDVASPPKVIAQTVWLVDRWQRTWLPKRWLFRQLLSKADVLTFLSSSNHAEAARLFPGQRAEVVLFGIRSDEMAGRPQREIHSTLRILSVGNDVHRDWATLVAALCNAPDCELRIVTGRHLGKLTQGAANVSVVRLRENVELMELYEWADLVVVPLRPNLHASGITVVEEAIIRGLPVICTDVGGLRSYFSEGEVRYVPPNDPGALHQAVTDLAADRKARERMVERAQARLRDAEITSRGYAMRHVELSRDLLGRMGPKEQS